MSKNTHIVKHSFFIGSEEFKRGVPCVFDKRTTDKLEGNGMIVPIEEKKSPAEKAGNKSAALPVVPASKKATPKKSSAGNKKIPAKEKSSAQTPLSE